MSWDEYREGLAGMAYLFWRPKRELAWEVGGVPVRVDTGCRKGKGAVGLCSDLRWWGVRSPERVWRRGWHLVMRYR